MTEPARPHISLISPEKRAALGIKVRDYTKKHRQTVEQMRKARGLPAPTRAEPVLCEICGRPPTARYKRLALDHDHETKAFRGWLCNRCNTALGMLGDTLEALERVVAYLRRSRQ